jgi:hypothetical protein
MPQNPETDEYSVPSDEKQLFLASIRIARDKLKESALVCSEISKARSLAEQALREIYKAIAIYSIYLSTDVDDLVPAFIDSAAIAATAAKSVNNAFIAYAREKKPISVDEVGAIVYKQVTILDKLLDD